MRKIYLFLLVALLSLQAGAQADLKFTQSVLAPVLVGTDSGQTIQGLSDSIYNIGNIQVDTVYLYAKVNATAPVPIGTFAFSGANSLDTGGSPATARQIAFSLSMAPVGTAGFVSGPNGVIIWPLYAGHNGPGDSISLLVTIGTIAGINETSLAHIYIIQRGGNLNIQFGDHKDLIQQVSLYDMSGRRLYSGSADQSQNISTGGWSAGVYFCEIMTYEGERRTIKFVLQ